MFCIHSNVWFFRTLDYFRKHVLKVLQFTVCTFFLSTLDPVKLLQSSFPWLEFNQLKYRWNLGVEGCLSKKLYLNSPHYQWMPCIMFFFKMIYKFMEWSLHLELTFTALPVHWMEARNSRVTKSIYETKLRKMTSYFELLTRKFL